MWSWKPRLCYITDRRSLEPRPVLPVIQGAIEAGIDLVQIREKDLPTLGLLRLVEAAVEATRGTGPGGAMVSESVRVVVNDRLDVALAAGAHGVHLGGKSMPPEKVRVAVPALDQAFSVGVSCHSVEDVLAAEAAGADYAFLGPIFEPTSKLSHGFPLGLGTLGEAARRSRITLLALGGITPERVRSCLEAGATGIAGISIFQDCTCVAERVRELRRAIAEIDGVRAGPG
jgi:thiamine-phosphate pyrophosphorylase